MAKGDANRMQNQIDYQGGTAQNNLNQMRNNFGNQNSTMWSNYQNAVGQGNSDYGDLMSRYRSATDSANNIGANSYAGYQNMAANGAGAGFDATPMNEAIAGYREFAKTGGYSDQDQQNIRARATSPIRAAYANAQNELARNRALQGGYSPNMAAAIASMAREQGQGEADALTNANANLAQMIQQGKLAGLGGESSTGLGLAGMNLQADQINNQAKLAALSGMSDIDRARFMGNLSGLQGMSSLYSATPGMAAMFGSQLANSNNNLAQTQGMQNDIMQAIMNGQYQKSQIPGNFQSIMGNLGSIANFGGSLASLFSPFGKKGVTPGVKQ